MPEKQLKASTSHAAEVTTLHVEQGHQLMVQWRISEAQGFGLEETALAEFEIVTEDALQIPTAP